MSASDYVPPGIEFYDSATRQTMRIVTKGHNKGWLVRKHGHAPDWVTVREATRDDLERVTRAIYDQEVVDMLAQLAIQQRPPHNQDPGGKLRNRSRLQWNESRRLQQADIAKRLQGPGGRFRKRPT